MKNLIDSHRFNYFMSGLTAFLVITVIGCGASVTDIPGLVKSYSTVTSYTVEIKAPNAPVMKQSVKIKDGKIIKMKMGTPMGVSIMDMEAKCNYVTMGGSIMKMPLDADAMEDSSAAMSPQEYETSGAKVVRSEKMGEVDCLVIESTKDGESGTIWIGKSDGLVRQVVNGKDKVEFSYTDINSVKDSEFELPKDAKVKDMTQMMGNFQKMMGN